jgi:molecular chaperone GrpE
MDNFRKRQQRLAKEQVASERERLLRPFLRASDDLRRALSAGGPGTDGLREGVDLTYRQLIQALDEAGVQTIDPMGQEFDPGLHDAVATVPYHTAGVEPHTVVDVLSMGYRMDGRLLSPARVVVAV